MKTPSHYCCLGCDIEWEEDPNDKGEYPGPTACTACGHIYVLWVNFDAMRGRDFNK